MTRPFLSLAATLFATPALASPPAVVADIAPVQSLVAQVMGDLGQPLLLLDRGSDPHAFQLRPSQARALSDAGLVFWIGPEMTPWLERALEGAGSAGESVALLHAAGTHTRFFEDTQGGHGDHDAHDHDAGNLDPHAWLDPANAEAWLAVIAERLSAADPENAATYAANATAAQAALAALDADLSAKIASAAQRKLYVYHDAYGYFAEAYGLTIAGSLAEGDAAGPGAAAIKALRDEIRAAGDGACVFAEAGHDPAMMQTLVEVAGLKLGTLDPTGMLLPPGPDLYAGMLTGLADAIADCGG